MPVLLQMSLNIGTLVTTLETGKQLSSAEAAAIQNISKEAGKDLALLQVLCNQYKANPSATTIQKSRMRSRTSIRTCPCYCRPLTSAIRFYPPG